MKPRFFASPDQFRAWLETNHGSASELLVGFWKKGSGRPSIDWPQARDQALCFGWIDGIRKALDGDSYAIRFTPRRAGSEWSRVNVERFQALEAKGLVAAAGRRAFEAGRENRSHYSYEGAPRDLDPGEITRFKANPAAWANWERRPPGYRKMVLHWVTSAKRPETRARRLATLIADSAAGRKIAGVDISRKRREG